MTGDGRWSTAARAVADELWEAQHRHPVVRGIADGTLAVDRLERWVREDWCFLVDYARVLAFAAGRATELDAVARWAEVAHSTLADELRLHRSYAAQFGITEDELADHAPGRATAGYTDFLLRCAVAEPYEVLVAALLPCMWGFSEIGLRLAAEGAAPEDERYRAWIGSYADEGFAALAAWCRDEADRAASRVDDAARAAMTRAFLRCSEHELAFWDQVLQDG
ncbi:thiaminase II [Conexibacter sp. SYSU D00693]|uniref:thiaminase II n=1 Tax=Conexibacter sp. SYSU D00693 TaxID=2812560 RepID=UPI00196BB000|nr:thiaminase II [Conexibacter sp. SYSU D00693]